MERLIKKLVIKTKMELLTGIHVGGSKESVEIGGIDNPVIKIGTKDNQPYLPGSSLKGKMRCLLEQIAGSAEIGGNPQVNDLFGFAKDGKPSKLIVRDAYLDDNDAKSLKENDLLDMPYTEGKWENVIDRIKGIADHPRQMERVPAGVKFDVEFVINVWDDDADGEKSLALLKKGIKALENDYLGGSGSRGYGQVIFHELNQTEISFKNYFTHENQSV
jgi:CRISPR-associated protein Csm3